MLANDDVGVDGIVVNRAKEHRSHVGRYHSACPFRVNPCIADMDGFLLARMSEVSRLYTIT
jgi:hypothetical protein